MPQWKALGKYRGRLDEERDRREYEGYKAILGKRVPESFEKFKDLKYNDGNGYEQLKREYKDEKLRQNIKETYN